MRDEDPPVRNVGLGRDISIGGMFIETARRHLLGERILVYLTLPGSRVRMVLPAFGRWVDKDGLGVQFALLSPQDAHEIAAYVRSSEAPRSGGTER